MVVMEIVLEVLDKKICNDDLDSTSEPRQEKDVPDLERVRGMR